MGEEWLSIERSINRDATGHVLPEIIHVEGITLEDGSHPKIKVDPIPRYKFLEINKLAKEQGGETTRMQDTDIIKAHCILPAYTDDHLSKMSIKTINAIVYAILSASTGIEQSDIKKSSFSQVVNKQEELLKKK